MMSSEDYNHDDKEENVETLYNRFKQNIGRKDDNVYFDEDDLIEIYEYAEEHFDDFVKMEVLFYGARMFPDSEFLQVRRRVMYSDMGNEQAVAELLQHCDNPSTLDKILLFRQDPEAGIEGLKKILDEADTLDDEDVIQFLGELNDNDFYPWLKKNFKLIVDKSSNPENTYFNTLLTAKENGDTKWVIKLAEELTMLQPFNIEYLELLAANQYDEGQYAEALSTLEYSLALDPKSTKSLILKANSLAGIDPDSEEACNILESLKEDDDFAIYGGWKVLINLMMNRNETSRLIKMLKAGCQMNGTPFDLIETLMLIDPQHIDEYTPFLQKSEWPDFPDFWFSRAVKFINTDLKIASILLTEGFRRHHFIKGLDMYLEILYCSKQFKNVIQVYRQMQEYALKMPDCALIYILALARTEQTGQAVKMAKQIIKHMSADVEDNPVSISVPDYVDEDGLKASPTTVTLAWMMHIGSTVLFKNIINALDRQPPLPLDDFDPLVDYMQN